MYMCTGTARAYGRTVRTVYFDCTEAGAGARNRYHAIDNVPNGIQFLRLPIFINVHTTLIAGAH